MTSLGLVLIVISLGILFLVILHRIRYGQWPGGKNERL